MTSPWRDDFGPFDGRVWLNCAHQGPLPRAAAAAAQEAIAWKLAPHHLTTERFQEVPRRLRQALGRLLGVSPDDVVLGNSASYGLHLLANGIPWRPGDEVLLVAGDFPSDLLPWLALEKKGVTLRFLEPRGPVLEADELLPHLTAASRLLCLTWVHSLTGGAVDLDALGAACRERGVRLVVNASQGVGARPLDLARAPVDALLGVGFKWLCGPYGTGYCWLRPDLRESLEYNQAYWLAMQTADDLAHQPPVPTPRTDLGARRYDVFGTANFFNFKPWAAAVEYLLAQGVAAVAEHDQRLVARLLDGLDPERYRVLSPRQGERRSTLVYLSHRDPGRNRGIYEGLKAQGIDPAFRRGALRFSPHLYNTDQDIDRALAALAELG